MNTAIIVPIKDHARAKSRMSSLLSPEERAALAWALFEDLLAALSAPPCPVVVTTNSSRVAARAHGLGWAVLAEGTQTSESASVDACSRRLAEQDVEVALRIPADLPLIRAEDITEILSLPITPPGVILVPSCDGSGTNALLRTPPVLFPSRFGPDSFALHMRAAAAAGAEIRVVENNRIALDLDDPSDISRFLAWQVENQTYRTLMEFNITERLAGYAAQRNSNLRFTGNS